MIISHEHRYAFVELNLTASTTIATELCELYDGVRMLRRHATYYDFLRVASDEEKEYFTFSCIRNPLDVAVSLYHKYQSNHQGQFTDRERWKKRPSMYLYYHLIARRRFDFVQKSDADFASYFKRYYHVPYNNWSALSHRDFDFVIRFENLQDDFSEALSLLGVEQKRPLPQLNVTKGRQKHYLAHYTPDVRSRAKSVFGPFMQEWGYEFPPKWGNDPIPWWSEAAFRLLNIPRYFYWRYVR